MNFSPRKRLALLCALPLIPAAILATCQAGEKPVVAWDFGDYKAGSGVKEAHGVTLTREGTVEEGQGPKGTKAADFSQQGAFGSPQSLATQVGEVFTVVSNVQLGALPEGYGNIVSCWPVLVVRMMGRNLEVGCDGDWHAISAVKADEMMGRWTQVAATFDGTVYQLYLNGEKVGSRDATQVIKTGGSIRIGGAIPRADRPEDFESFPGLIADVTVFDSVLTPEQLKELPR